MATREEVVQERNRLVSSGVAIVVLAVLAAAVLSFPGTDRVAIGYLSIGGVIRIVLLAVMLGMVISARIPLCVISVHYVSLYFREQRPATAKAAVEHVDSLGKAVANSVVILASWIITSRMVLLVLLMETRGTLGWLSILTTVGFVLLLLYTLYKGYGHLGPLLNASGGGAPTPNRCPVCGQPQQTRAKYCARCGASLRTRAPDPAKKPRVASCPACGKPYATGARFCTGCGANLGGASPTTQAEENRNSCPSCGRRLAPGARFCTVCGRSLSGGSDGTE